MHDKKVYDIFITCAPFLLLANKFHSQMPGLRLKAGAQAKNATLVIDQIFFISRKSEIVVEKEFELFEQNHSIPKDLLLTS